MIATLLAHTGHIAPSSGIEARFGVALLLVGAATTLWRSRNQITRPRGHGTDGTRRAENTALGDPPTDHPSKPPHTPPSPVSELEILSCRYHYVDR